MLATPATYTLRGTLRGETFDGDTSEVPVEMTFSAAERADADGLAGLVEMLLDHEAAIFDAEPVLLADSALIIESGGRSRSFDLATLPSVGAYVAPDYPEA